MPALEYEHRDGVATLTLNNPPQNRLGGHLLEGFAMAATDLAQRRDTRAILINAKGQDFSYGGDISAWRDQTSDGFSEQVAGALALTNVIQDLPCPVIVAIQGYCGGGGFEIALRGDILIAAENAMFCHSEASIGVFTFLGGVQRVAERVGRTRAMQWAMTGERVGADQALSSGLVNEVVANEALADRAQEWVELLRHSATRSHAAHKRLLRAWSDGGVAGADALIAEMAGPTLHSKDAQSVLPAAIDAMLAGKQRPHFDFNGE